VPPSVPGSFPRVSQPDTPLVRVEVGDGVATITLDSPHNRNALSTRLTGELVRALQDAAADTRIRVVVLTGAGPVFCSGVDLREQRERNEGGTADRAGWSLPDLFRQVEEHPTPVLAAVNGPARAGGIGLLASCDVVLARRSATFAFTEVRLGVVPAVISVPVLRYLPARAAAELFLTGEVFSAERAAAIGLLTAVVDDEALESEAARYAGLLRLGGPDALRHTKDVLRDVPRMEPAGAYEAMSALSLDRFASAEAGEGMRAFAEKRPPSWARVSG
jgi:methylglutaconyl-CoA hydratase